MKLTCLQENLSRALNTVGRAVATRTTLPITQNVLISTDQSKLKLTATNLEIAISTWMGADIEEEGSITIPARLLTEFVNSLPSERIEIASTEQPKGLDLQCARFNAHINGTDADEFPPVPSVDSGVMAKMESKDLKKAISHVAFAAATEESRPVLTGTKVDMSDQKVVFAAADGFRLAVYNADLAEAVSEETSFIVPARSLQEVNRAIGAQGSPIEFTVTPSKSQVLFRLDDIEIVSQLIQGTFPDYAQLIPQNYGARVIMKREDFLRVTRSASIFARDGSGIVRLEVSNEEGEEARLKVSSRAEELGDNEGSVDAKIEGENAETKIAFNSKYLSEVLDNLLEDEVALETTTSSSPGVIRPVDSDNEYLHVVMPMFVQW